MTDQSESFRREALRLLEAAKRVHDEDIRAALMALAKRYLEQAKAAAPNVGQTSEVYSEF
jgi:predicted metal-dependent hydrolase